MKKSSLYLKKFAVKKLYFTVWMIHKHWSFSRQSLNALYLEDLYICRYPRIPQQTHNHIDRIPPSLHRPESDTSEGERVTCRARVSSVGTEETNKRTSRGKKDETD